MAPTPIPTIADARLGATATVTKTVSESDVYLYAGITGDFSPNHVDEVFMKESAYGARVAHGTLLMGFMSAASAKMYLGRTVSLGYDRVRFIKPVLFGDTISTTYEITRVDQDAGRLYADVTCRNQRDEVVAAASNIRKYIG